MLESLYEKFGVAFANGGMVFCEYEIEEECYFLLEGEVKITKTVGSAQKILDLIKKGNFFGEMAILESEPRSASAIAVGDVRALKFNRASFDAMIHSQPQLALQLLVSFCGRIYDAKRRLQILLLKNTEIRVSDVFVMLSEKDDGYGKASRMVFNVTTEDVASWCGLTAEEVQKVLNLFVNRGKIEVYLDRIIIHNINDFSRLVAYHRKKLSG